MGTVMVQIDRMEPSTIVKEFQSIFAGARGLASGSQPIDHGSALSPLYATLVNVAVPRRTLHASLQVLFFSGPTAPVQPSQTEGRGRADDCCACAVSPKKNNKTCIQLSPRFFITQNRVERDA